MRLFFLDDEYTHHLILAESEDDAWRKLEKRGIFRSEAYHPDSLQELVGDHWEFDAGKGGLGGLY